jgi:hypothetical protein
MDSRANIPSVHEMARARSGAYLSSIPSASAVQLYASTEAPPGCRSP